jgi:hypothetical protein
MPPKTVSFEPVKIWVKQYIDPNNELHDAILMERDTMSEIEATMKIAAYNNMLEAKAQRLKKGTTT